MQTTVNGERNEMQQRPFQFTSSPVFDQQNYILWARPAEASPHKWWPSFPSYQRSLQPRSLLHTHTNT